jgi:IK cytokine
LEQNKAKAAVVSNVEDDEALEQAFLGIDEGDSTEVVETVAQPKKKSRQDLIRELKEKRGQDKPVKDKATDAGLEEAKKAGKFKPIGFKPIGGDSEGKKRRKEKEGGEKKKKKRKVEDAKDRPSEASSSTQPLATPAPATLPEEEEQSAPAPAPEPEPLDPSFDIFAGVEEYTGEIGDDEDEDEHSAAEGLQESQPDVDQSRRGWFEGPKSPTPPKEPTPPAEEPSEMKDEEMEEQAPARLAPLASSMSVKDILAIDDAVAKEQKRKARKEKKKKNAELNPEGKANRDYQKWVPSFLVPCMWDIHLGFAG